MVQPRHSTIEETGYVHGNDYIIYRDTPTGVTNEWIVSNLALTLEEIE